MIKLHDTSRVSSGLELDASDLLLEFGPDFLEISIIELSNFQASSIVEKSVIFALAIAGIDSLRTASSRATGFLSGTILQTTTS